MWVFRFEWGLAIRARNLLPRGGQLHAMVCRGWCRQQARGARTVGAYVGATRPGRNPAVCGLFLPCQGRIEPLASNKAYAVKPRPAALSVSCSRRCSRRGRDRRGVVSTHKPHSNRKSHLCSFTEGTKTPPKIARGGVRPRQTGGRVGHWARIRGPNWVPINGPGSYLLTLNEGELGVPTNVNSAPPLNCRATFISCTCQLSDLSCAEISNHSDMPNSH